MRAEERAVALVAPHCDIVDRLAVVPPSAQIRGIWMRAVEKQIVSRGQLSVYREFFPEDRYSVLPFYPVSQYLVRLACAGALAASPERVHEGMYLIMKDNAEAFMETLLGRVMLRVLSRDPVRLTEQGVAARRQSFSYGRWELRRTGDRELEIVHQEEYSWIESAIAGSCQGTFEACGITGQIETKLIDRFNGSTFLRW
jgi:uncharacterized protein (TIGR02265 family)